MRNSARARGGYTLLEVMMSMGIFMLVGGIIFELLRVGLILHTKNIAVNISHQQARMAMDRMSKDIQTAISVPTLTDTGFNAVSNPYAMCAGISFLKLSSSVLQVNAPQTVTASQSTVQVITGSFRPTAGQWLIIPSYSIQQSISSVSTSGNISTLTLSSTVSNALSLSSTNNVVAMIASQVGYVVVNGQLLYYPQTSSTNYSVIARDIISTAPFTVPPN